MSDAIYDDPALVALYDVFNPWSDDSTFYLELAGDAPKRILDIGCGTGLLTCALAARGHRVTGLDPAPEMLRAAARRPGADHVRWICGGAEASPTGEVFDLILMTGHAFQVLLTDEAALFLLRAARASLGPNGQFAFETRNPANAPWLNWTPELSRQQRLLPDETTIESLHEVIERRDDRVTFETRYRLGAAPELKVSRSTLRFPDRTKLEELLHRAGFDRVTWLGDWQGGPLRADSHEIIVLAS